MFTRFRIGLDFTTDSDGSSAGAQFDTSVAAPTATNLGRYVMAVFEIATYGGVFTLPEKGMFGIHWINTTGGDLDTTWNTADFTAVESALTTFWNAVKANIPTEFRLVEYRWYAFGTGVHPPNPPVRITPVTANAGTGSAAGPHQLATTVTLRTPLRRHWGRFYLPLSTGVLSAGGGQLSNAAVDLFANSANTMLQAPGSSQGIVPVVYNRNSGHAYSVTQVECDSVPDIIRRRRPATTGYRKILSA
jgi:hypothetical protein